MERWALDALEEHMSESHPNSLKIIRSFDDKRTLMMQSKRLLLKEWLPEGESGDTQLSIIAPDTHRLRP